MWNDHKRSTKGRCEMRKQILSLLVENTAGVTSHISGLFSRRGYNIDSFSAGVTADPRFTRITIVSTGDEQVLEPIKKQLAKLTDLGFAHFPVCMAKNQYSLSDDPKLLGRPEGFEMTIREVYVSAGAGFVVVLTGDVMTMPGLPKKPAAYGIDVNEDGVITGLF